MQIKGELNKKNWTDHGDIDASNRCRTIQDGTDCRLRCRYLEDQQQKQETRGTMQEARHENGKKNTLKRGGKAHHRQQGPGVNWGLEESV